jgi:hypothetical protein
MNEDEDYTIVPQKEAPSLRSTPQAKQVSIKKKIIAPPKLQRFFMKANISYTTTYEKTNKSRKTNALHTHYYSRQEHQAIGMPVWAASEKQARVQFENEITGDIVL